MKAVTRAASIVLIVTWLVWMFAGYRSNAMLRDTKVAPISFCQSRPADFQMVEMKAPRCVATADARKWGENRRLLNATGLLGVLLVLALLYAQRRRRGDDASR